MKSTLGYRREKLEHHKPESDPPKPSVFVVGVPLLHHFLNVFDDDDDGAVVNCFVFWIRPSNVHAYIREVRPEHYRYRVQRKTGSSDLSLELFYTTQ